jgi:hypothetical protein
MSSFAVSFIAVFLLATTLAPAFAADHTTHDQHVRTSERVLTTLMRQGIAESPYFRSLIERLNETDVIVYVKTSAQLPTNLEGHLNFLGSGGGRRYLVVSLAFGRPDMRTISTLGHELQHALEVAERPHIVDGKSMAKAFADFGYSSPTARFPEAFETDAAGEAGARVWLEMSRQIARQPDSSYGLDVAP